MINWIGSAVTAVFAVSSSTENAPHRAGDRRADVGNLTYGFLIGATPVVVANVIVAIAGVYSSFAPARSAPAT
jgi:hypothetical protein